MVATYTTINTHVRILFPFPILFIIARNEWPGSYSWCLFSSYCILSSFLCSSFRLTLLLSACFIQVFHLLFFPHTFVISLTFITFISKISCMPFSSICCVCVFKSYLSVDCIQLETIEQEQEHSFTLSFWVISNSIQLICSGCCLLHFLACDLRWFTFGIHFSTFLLPTNFQDRSYTCLSSWPVYILVTYFITMQS